MVSNIISKGKDLLFKEEENILSAGMLIGISLLTSALLGLIRFRLFSHFFGAEPYFSQLGLYFAADRIPSLIFNVIVVSTLATAFIPVFTNKIREGKERAWVLASNTLNSMLIVFAFLSLLVFIFSMHISKAVALGSLDNESIVFMSRLLRIMIFSQLILVISSFFTSMLQSFKRFLVPALAPVLYNLGIIIFLILFAKRFGVVAPALGMVFGAFLHLLIQLYFIRSMGFRYAWIINFKDRNLIEILRLMAPRTLGLAANQLSLLVDTSLALFLGSSYVVIFNFAQRLQEVPVNFFGAAMSQAAFPIMSALSDNKKEFSKTVLNTFKQIMFFTLPISILFIILRIPLVRLVFGASKFSWDATISTSYALAFFSISMVFQALVYLLNRAFYSLRDTATPVKVAIISVGLNIVLAAIFIMWLGFGIWSLSFSFSISSFINFILLFILLGKRTSGFFELNFLYDLSKISWASLFTAFFLYIPMKLLDKVVFDTTRTFNLLALTFVVFLAGFCSYVFLSKLLDIKERVIVLSAIKFFFKSYHKAPSKLISKSMGDKTF